MFSRTKVTFVLVCVLCICVNGIIIKDEESEEESAESRSHEGATSYILTQTGDSDPQIIYLNGKSATTHFQPFNNFPKHQSTTTTATPLRPVKQQSRQFSSEFIRLANEYFKSRKQPNIVVTTNKPNNNNENAHRDDDENDNSTEDSEEDSYEYSENSSEEDKYHTTTTTTTPKPKKKSIPKKTTKTARKPLPGYETYEHQSENPRFPGPFLHKVKQPQRSPSFQRVFIRQAIPGFPFPSLASYRPLPTYQVQNQSPYYPNPYVVRQPTPLPPEIRTHPVPYHFFPNSLAVYRPIPPIQLRPNFGTVAPPIYSNPIELPPVNHQQHSPIHLPPAKHGPVNPIHLLPISGPIYPIQFNPIKHEQHPVQLPPSNHDEEENEHQDSGNEEESDKTYESESESSESDESTHKSVHKKKFDKENHSENENNDKDHKSDEKHESGSQKHHKSGFEKLGGEKFNRENRSRKGFKKNKGFNKFGSFGKGNKKEYDEDYLSEAQNNGKTHEAATNNDGKQQQHQRNGYQAENGGKFNEIKSRKKGSKTTGYHNVFHKDEYKRVHVFYDDVDHRGAFKTYGSNHEHHDSIDNDTDENQQHASDHNNGDSPKNGNIEAGQFNSTNKGFHRTHDNDNEYNNEVQHIDHQHQQDHGVSQLKWNKAAPKHNR